MEFAKIMEQVNDWDNFFEYLDQWVIESNKCGIYPKSFVEDCFSISRMKFYIEDFLELKILQPKFGEIYVYFHSGDLIHFSNDDFAELLFGVIKYAKSF